MRNFIIHTIYDENWKPETEVERLWHSTRLKHLGVSVDVKDNDNQQDNS